MVNKVIAVVGLATIVLLGGCIEQPPEQYVTLEYLGQETIYTVDTNEKKPKVSDKDFAFYRINDKSDLIVQVDVGKNDRLEGESENYNILTKKYENVPITTRDMVFSEGYNFKQLNRLNGEINMNGVSQPFRFVEYNRDRKEYEKYADSSNIETIALEFIGLNHDSDIAEENGTDYEVYFGLSDKVLEVDVKEYERYSNFLSTLGDKEYQVINTFLQKYILLDNYWYPFEYTDDIEIPRN